VSNVPLEVLWAALAVVSTARADPSAQPQVLDVSARGFARLELDDRVLAGPAYGGGFEALVHVWRPLWVGGYVEWSRPSEFAEVGPCADTTCERSQRMFGGVLGIVFPVAETGGRFRIDLGAGHRRHVVEHQSYRIVSDGVDFIRGSAGYDAPIVGPAYIGGFFDWSMGCFTSMRREDTSGRQLDLGKTCFEAPFWVSAGLGARVGVAL